MLGEGFVTDSHPGHLKPAAIAAGETQRAERMATQVARVSWVSSERCHGPPEYGLTGAGLFS